MHEQTPGVMEFAAINTCIEMMLEHCYTEWRMPLFDAQRRRPWPLERERVGTEMHCYDVRPHLTIYNDNVPVVEAASPCIQKQFSRVTC